MTRLTTWLLFLAAVYLGLMVLLARMSILDDFNLNRLVWNVSAAALLTATAYELALLPLWLWCVATRKLNDADELVPERIDLSERQMLSQSFVSTAILLPAHREATTQEDREQLIKRVFDILVATPAWSQLFLLFDSPRSEAGNERRVFAELQRRLMAAGRITDVPRIHINEYRDKPTDLRSKPGSIVMWLEENRCHFPFFFVLDADSSMAAEPASNREALLLERLVWTMQRNPRLAMIQTAIEQRGYTTLWGVFQSVGCWLAEWYHAPVFQHLYQGQAICYGHSVLFRTSQFISHARNFLQFRSHDFVDSADLCTAGCLTISTARAVTFETPENSLLSFLLREKRWSGGNAQWLSWLLLKKRPAIGPLVFLTVGLLTYFWPLLACVLVIASLYLADSGQPVLATTDTFATILLVLAVTSALVLPRVLPVCLAGRGFLVAFASVIAGALLSPALMLFRGLLILIGIYETRWVPRGARSTDFDLDHIFGHLTLFLPVAIAAALLDWSFTRDLPLNTGVMLIRTHLVLMMLSPLFALAFSTPLSPRSRLLRKTRRTLTCLPG